MFSDRLKKLRTAQGISQVEFAKRFDISTGTIGNWEVGNREPDFNTVQKIADYFDVSIDYLLGRSDDPSPRQTKAKDLIVPEELKDVKMAFYGGAEDLTSEDLKIVAALVKTLQNKNRK